MNRGKNEDGTVRTEQGCYNIKLLVIVDVKSAMRRNAGISPTPVTDGSDVNVYRVQVPWSL